ncbi:cytochrome P450 302a1, mitochondrial [Trichonephila inaurata madagascariensis]|uniref:Cytochrome P450 302a1, mitochondrial n=1 Tax=Trichonephila inaurata madagascariensis TaxID=2747483 RepID=A0A8X6X8B8_9ARAC|nr:cytochrome P450 302a1, mitochondrial [Trichonephila inaurata madagascariensis]
MRKLITVWHCCAFAHTGISRIAHIHESYHRWVKDVGHVVKEILPEGDICVHVYHKDDFRAVNVNDGIRPLRKSHRVLAKYRRERPKVYNSAGLGASLDDDWVELRRMLTDAEKLLHLLFQPYLEQITDDFINLVRIKLDENNEINILRYLYRWALESFGLIAFNRRLNALSEKVNKETDALIHSARQMNETIFLGNVCDYQRQYKRLIPVQDYFSKVMVTYMLEAVSDPDRDCLLNRLLEKGHNEKDVVTVILDMFQGAISCIPLTLTWALYHLSYSPDIFIQSRAREELIEIMPNKDSRYYELNKPVQEYLFIKSRAPCVQAILRETLRLIPPTIGIGRVNREDLILGGYLVPAGNMIILQSQAACRLEEYFEQPLKFIPSRFMNLKELNPELKINFPFGLGHRACVGFSFAHAQMIMALSKILRNFEVSHHHEEVDVINRLYNEPDRPILLRMKPLEN